MLKIRHYAKPQTVITPSFAPDYRYFDQTGVEDCASLDLKDDEALLTDEERFEREKRRMTKAFRMAYPRDAQVNDDLHGEGNWWAEGSAKHGFELYFAN